MKTLFTLFFAAVTIVHAQPAGRLYVHLTGGALPGVLGYVEYPQQQFHFIDSLDIHNMRVRGNEVLTAGFDVRRYDRVMGTLIDSIPGIAAIDVEEWNNQLIVISQSDPYFRVFDKSSGSLIYSIPSPQVLMVPNVLHVTGDRAFLLFNDSIQVIDLIQQATVTTFHTPQPFISAGLNSYAIERDSLLYVVVRYITGAIRFSLLSVNINSFQVETRFHHEGGDVWLRPVITGDTIFMEAFDSYYVISADTFIYNPVLQRNPVAYDTVSSTMFYYHFPSSLYTYSNGTFQGPVGLNGPLQFASFVPDFGSAIIETGSHQPAVYPNPAVKNINVSWKNKGMESLRVHNAGGAVCLEIKIDPAQFDADLSIEGLASGNYFVVLEGGGEKFTATFNKQ